jgi:hypothetical protein
MWGKSSGSSRNACESPRHSMHDDELHRPSLEVRIIFRDPPDLFELEADVRTGRWRGVATAYVSPISLRTNAVELVAWSRDLQCDFKIDAGIPNASGMLALSFVPHDQAGHLECGISLVTSPLGRRDSDRWRLSLSIRTEPGLVERFAKQLISLCDGAVDEAVLEGLAI